MKLLAVICPVKPPSTASEEPFHERQASEYCIVARRVSVPICLFSAGPLP